MYLSFIFFYQLDLTTTGILVLMLFERNWLHFISAEITVHIEWNHANNIVLKWNERGFRPPLCACRLNWASPYTRAECLSTLDILNPKMLHLIIGNINQWYVAMLVHCCRWWPSIEPTLGVIYEHHKPWSATFNHLKPEFTIVIFLHYKPRIAIAILGL